MAVWGGRWPEHALGQDLKHPLCLAYRLTSISIALNTTNSCMMPVASILIFMRLWISVQVLWFCQAVLSAQQDASASIEFVLKKAKFWEAQTHKTSMSASTKCYTKLFAAGD